MREPDDHHGPQDGQADAQELARIAERNRLILRVMEINAKQRHLEALFTGLSLELDLVSRAAGMAGATEAQRETAAGLKQQHDAAWRQLEKLAVEREWLARMLAELDGAVPPTADPRQGHA
jgi:hypothetical protein